MSANANLIFPSLKLVHEKVYDSVVEQLLEAYKQVKIGDPLEKGTLLGPLHTRASTENFEKGIKVIKSQVSIAVGELKKIIIIK